MTDSLEKIVGLRVYSPDHGSLLGYMCPENGIVPRFVGFDYSLIPGLTEDALTILNGRSHSSPVELSV